MGKTSLKKAHIFAAGMIAMWGLDTLAVAQTTCDVSKWIGSPQISFSYSITGTASGANSGTQYSIRRSARGSGVIPAAGGGRGLNWTLFDHASALSPVSVDEQYTFNDGSSEIITATASMPTVAGMGIDPDTCTYQLGFEPQSPAVKIVDLSPQGAITATYPSDNHFVFYPTYPPNTDALSLSPQPFIPSPTITGTVTFVADFWGDFNGFTTPNYAPSSWTVTWTVSAGSSLQIQSKALPNATVGQPYSSTLSASGGIPPYQWFLTEIPDNSLNFALDRSTGAITANPTSAGSYPVSVALWDSQQAIVNRSFALIVSGSQSAESIRIELKRDAIKPNQGMLALATATGIDGGPDNLQDAAQKLGFDHFNWLQTIVSDLDLQACAALSTPVPPQCASDTTVNGMIPAVPTFDAPYGGYAYQYWATYCPGSTCSFVAPVRDYWPMYWDEYFSAGPPYLPSPANPLYRSKYRTGSTIATMGATGVQPNAALGFSFSDVPTTNFQIAGTGGVREAIIFGTALVGVSGSCNVLVSSNCTFQIFPGTTFRWTSVGGIVGFTSSSGTASSALRDPTGDRLRIRTVEHEDDFPGDPVDLSGADLSNAVISANQFLALAGLTPQSLAAIGGSIARFPGSLIPTQAAALAAVQAGLTFVSPTAVTITTSGLAYSRLTQTFNGTVTVTNVSGSSIAGPLQIVFNGLPASVTMTDATGNFAGTPYLTVPTISLAPEESMIVNIQFRNTTGAALNIAPTIYSGNVQ